MIKKGHFYEKKIKNIFRIEIKFVKNGRRKVRGERKEKSR